MTFVEVYFLLQENLVSIMEQYPAERERIRCVLCGSKYAAFVQLVVLPNDSSPPLHSLTCYVPICLLRPHSSSSSSSSAYVLMYPLRWHCVLP